MSVGQLQHVLCCHAALPHDLRIVMLVTLCAMWAPSSTACLQGAVNPYCFVALSFRITYLDLCLHSCRPFDIEDAPGAVSIWVRVCIFVGLVKQQMPLGPPSSGCCACSCVGPVKQRTPRVLSRWCGSWSMSTPSWKLSGPC